MRQNPLSADELEASRCSFNQGVASDYLKNPLNGCSEDDEEKNYDCVIDSSDDSISTYQFLRKNRHDFAMASDLFLSSREYAGKKADEAGNMMAYVFAKRVAARKDLAFFNFFSILLDQTKDDKDESGRVLEKILLEDDSEESKIAEEARITNYFYFKDITYHIFSSNQLDTGHLWSAFAFMEHLMNITSKNVNDYFKEDELALCRRTSGLPAKNVRHHD